MWTTQIELESGDETKPLLGNRFQKLSILSSRERIAYLEVIQLWQQEKSFCSFWTEVLATAPFSAYFWETPPVSLSSVDRAFEFVLVNSPQLARKSPTPSNFQEYFKSTSPEQEVVTFPN